jgi:hypothetical protein
MSQVPTNTELQARADAKGAVFVNESKLKASIKQVDFMVHPGSCLTVCVVTLLNGYTVTGESACADPKMYDAEIGQKFAFAAAERKVWPLLGYALREELFKKEQETGEPETFATRLRREEKELSEKLEKLEAFINGNVQYDRLDMFEQNDLREQLASMKEYRDILARRLARQVG